MEICTVRIILEKLAERQDSECCKADFWQVRRIVCLEILRCYSESISMKVSDLIIYIMKIMWRDIKKRFSAVTDRRQSKPRRKWTEQMNADPLSCKREAVAMTQMEQPSLDCYGKKRGLSES